jgi:hypothetical protein
LAPKLICRSAALAPSSSGHPRRPAHRLFRAAPPRRPVPAAAGSPARSPLTEPGMSEGSGRPPRRRPSPATASLATPGQNPGAGFSGSPTAGTPASHLLRIELSEPPPRPPPRRQASLAAGSVTSSGGLASE